VGTTARYPEVGKSNIETEEVDQGGAAFGIVAWGIASIALGLGTGQIAWSLLAFLAIPLAVPFGYPNDYEYSEPLPIWWGVAICAFFSAGLIFLAALAGPIVEKLRKPRP
jgi:hypothetical protein